MGDSEDKEATGSQQFEVAGLSRRALLDRMKALGLGFGAAYMLGITNADAAAPSGGTARIRSNDEAIDAIIEEGEGASDRTQVADAGGNDNTYSRTYNRGGGYSRGYNRDYSRGYNRDYSRGYNRDYSRGYSRDYSRGGYSRGGYSRGGYHHGYHGYHGYHGRRYGQHGGHGWHGGNRYHGGGRRGGGGGHRGGGGGHRGGGGGRGGRGGGHGGGRKSDIRSKENVVLLGHLANGLGFYRFNYIAEDTTYVGVMAQEVLTVNPDAVTRGSDGYLRVFYEKLGLRMQTFEEWKDEGGTIPTPVH